MNEEKDRAICKNVFKNGSETSKEAFTSALARAIMRIENKKPCGNKETEEQRIKRMDT